MKMVNTHGSSDRNQPSGRTSGTGFASNPYANRTVAKRPLRILHILETSGGGSSRHIIDLINSLSALGHENHLIYGTCRITDDFAASLADLPVAKRIGLPLRRNPHPLDVVHVAKIRNYLLSEGPFDIIHGHSSKGGALARLAAFGSGASCIYTPHAFITMDPTLPTPKYRIFSTVEKLLSYLTDAIITVSRAEFRHALALGISERRLHLIVNGMRPFKPSKRSAVRAELGIPQNDFVIGFVARLVPQKAPARMIQLMERLRDDGRRPILVMVGDGPLEPELKTQCRELGLANIQWAGALNGCHAMAAFDVLAVSSYYEGFPYIFLEALFQGVPVVSMEVGGTDDLIQSGENGFTVPQGDIDGLASAITYLMDNPAELARTAEAARRAGNIFSAEEMVGRTLALYQACQQKGRKKGEQSSSCANQTENA